MPNKPDKRKGRKQRKQSKKGQIRAPRLQRYYSRRLRDIRPGSFTFRVDVVRPEVLGRARRLTLDHYVTNISWEDTSAVLTGSLSLRREVPNKPLPIGENHRVILFVKWGSRWIKLWTMTVDGTPTVDVGSGEVTVSLKDALEGLRRNQRDWEFKKGKKTRKKGYKAHQIARIVCRREGVKIGRLAAGTEWIPKLKKDGATALDVIKAAYAQEAKKTGRKYVFRFQNGKFYVVQLKRRSIVYEVAGQARSISLEGKSKDKRPRTVIEAKAKIKKDGKWEKIEATIFRRRLVRRYGRVTWEKNYGKVDSRKELRNEAMRDLADEVRVKRSGSMEVSGVPFITRGDTIFWRNREPGWHGKTKDIKDRRYAYVTSVSHSVTHGEYTTSIDFEQEDPYLKDARRRAEEQREKKKKKREKNDKENRPGNEDDDDG